MINDKLLVRGDLHNFRNKRIGLAGCRLCSIREGRCTHAASRDFSSCLSPPQVQDNLDKEVKKVFWIALMCDVLYPWCYINIMLYCHTMLYIHREFKSSRQTQVAQVAIFKVESKYIDTGPELRDSEMELGLENVDDKWIFSGLLQHNQIKSGPSFKAFNDRNQTSKALTSCGVRMSSEFWWRRRSTRRSHDVFITLE